jgi:TonB family protein
LGRGLFHAFLFTALVAAIFGHPFLYAQHEHEHEMHNARSTELRYDTGILEHGRYSNQCLGFTYVIPQGWDISMIVGRDGKAKHLSDGGLDLLAIQQHTDAPPSNMLMLTARDAAGQAQSAEEFVNNSVREQIAARAGRALIREAYAVEYGGKKFARSDYRQSFSSGVTSYMSILETKFRGYYLGASLVTGSEEALDRAANSLGSMTFLDDQPNPACAAGEEAAPAPKAPRVRVSEGVSQAFIEKKVPPVYPPEARVKMVQGDVLLKVIITPTGDVSEVALLRGDPLLAPAAKDAVKQWKFKPYLLNGQPVEVETPVTVSFRLSASP